MLKHKIVFKLEGKFTPQFMPQSLLTTIGAIGIINKQLTRKFNCELTETLLVPDQKPTLRIHITAREEGNVREQAEELKKKFSKLRGFKLEEIKVTGVMDEDKNTP